MDEAVAKRAITKIAKSHGLKSDIVFGAASITVLLKDSKADDAEREISAYLRSIGSDYASGQVWDNATIAFYMRDRR